MIEKHCFGKAFFFWSKEPATSRVYVRVVYEGPLLAYSVEKLRFEFQQHFICDLLSDSYRRCEGGNAIPMKIPPGAAQSR